jgi:prolipoprotein diacylglyceryltransferase
MPKKPITWFGSIIILAAGIFCSWALFQYRARLPATVDTRFNLITAAAFLALIVAILAVFLWYYFNEKT